MKITVLSVLLGLLLLAVPGYVLMRLDVPLLQRLAKSVVRMVLQMAVVGALTWLLWRMASPWLCLVWLLAMAMVAAWVLVRRCRLQQGLLFLPVWAGVVAGVFSVGAYLLLTRRVAEPLSPLWLIPVGGVLMAHVLTTNIHGVSAYCEALKTDAMSYYTQLGNGASRVTMLTPYVRQGLRSMIEPTVASFTTMGLFALPMLLSGLLLGGVAPVEAVALYVLLVIGSVAASVVALIVTLWAADRRVFNKRGELKNVWTS